MVTIKPSREGKNYKMVLVAAGGFEIILPAYQLNFMSLVDVLLRAKVYNMKMLEGKNTNQQFADRSNRLTAATVILNSLETLGIK